MSTIHSTNGTLSRSGFTIVELLVVIVVIGILSGIVLIAYAGVRASSNTQSAKANASSLQRKIEAYAENTNAFPDSTTAAAYTNQLNNFSDSSVKSGGVSIGTPSNEAGASVAEVSQCATNPGMAYRIRYWNFTQKKLADDVLTGSVAAATCNAWTVLR